MHAQKKKKMAGVNSCFATISGKKMLYQKTKKATKSVFEITD